MRLQFLLLLGAAFLVTSTPHLNIVLETNITTLISVGSPTSTDRIDPKQLLACSDKVQSIDCVRSLRSQSSPDTDMASASSSHVEPSSSKASGTTSTAPSTASTSTAPNTLPTDTADRLRECFLGSTCGILFSNLTSFWKEIHIDVPMYEQDKEFAKLFCLNDNRVNFDNKCVSPTLILPILNTLRFTHPFPRRQLSIIVF